MTSAAHDATARRLLPTRQHVEQRRLADAVAADDRDALASQAETELANEDAPPRRLDRQGVALQKWCGAHDLLLRQARASSSTVDGPPSITSCVPRGVARLRNTRHSA